MKVVVRMPGDLELESDNRSRQERSGVSEQTHLCKTSRRFSKTNGTLDETTSMDRDIGVFWSER